MERYQVTERDMPARLIRQAARKVGFRDFQTYPHLSQWADLVYRSPSADANRPLLKGWARSCPPRGPMGHRRPGVDSGAPQ